MCLFQSFYFIDGIRGGRMNVKELIIELNLVKDKTKVVVCFNDGDLYFIGSVDDSIDDRLDLNLEVE